MEKFAVTGASSGLGRAMSGFLAQAGAGVVLLARRADAFAELLQRQCAAPKVAPGIDR